MEVKKITHLTGHSSAVYALENSLEENKFFSGSGDRIVAEWDLTSTENGQMLAQVPEIIYSLKLIPEKKVLLVGQSAGGIHVIDLLTRKEIRLLKYHAAGVFDLDYSSAHNLLFSLGGEGTFSISRLDDFTLIKSIKLADEKLRSVAIHPQQKDAAVGCGEGSICVFDLPSLELKKRWQAHKEKFSVNAVQFSRDGDYLLSGSRDAHLNIFDVKNNYKLMTSIPAHNYAIYSIVFSPGKKYFATASRDKTVKIWDAENFNVLIRLDKEKYEGHLNSVNKLLWKNDLLISGSDDRSIIVWQVNS
ncbi:MAG TPA: WD40 repeat domain-containing protein [Bacteroidia bacterium]|nr:WD40 repeat domain-containing protein [Bacteroidia bacterium]